ncbi:MAG: PAS domain-containing sensor histidine kinase [Chitinivibrionales bacterium]|nr:PAS domain-containing sensor histidine kinase [Chitinivibrionales bacterium]
MQRSTPDIDKFLERLPVGIITLGPDDQVVNVNEGALGLLDMRIEDALSGSFGTTVPVKEVRAALERIRENGSTQNFFFEQNGKYIKCSVSKSDNSEYPGEIIILENASAFRQMETIKREFIQNILFGLRNPLATLKTSLSILKSGKIAPLPAPVREIVELGAQEANRLNALLMDLRDLFYVETGLAEKEFESELFYAQKAIERAVADLEKTGDSCKGLNNRVRTEGNLGAKIKGDFEKTKRIIMHLLSNAAVYSPADSPVVVRLSGSSEKTTLEIRDSGIGVAEDKKPLLFTKYFREDNTITRAVHGNGLGLFISRSFAELMGGSIYCETMQGKGSSFFMNLPS